MPSLKPPAFFTRLFKRLARPARLASPSCALADLELPLVLLGEQPEFPSDLPGGLKRPFLLRSGLLLCSLEDASASMELRVPLLRLELLPLQPWHLDGSLKLPHQPKVKCHLRVVLTSFFHLMA